MRHVQPNAFVSQLDLISQERENADEARDGGQRVKGRGRHGLGHVTRISTRQKTLAKAANTTMSGCLKREDAVRKHANGRSPCKISLAHDAAAILKSTMHGLDQWPMRRRHVLPGTGKLEV